MNINDVLLNILYINIQNIKSIIKKYKQIILQYAMTITSKNEIQIYHK